MNHTKFMKQLEEARAAARTMSNSAERYFVTLSDTYIAVKMRKADFFRQRPRRPACQTCEPTLRIPLEHFNNKENLALVALRYIKAGRAAKFCYASHNQHS